MPLNENADPAPTSRADANGEAGGASLAEVSLATGTLIADRYRIESKLGEGGMGTVYLAEHVHIRKRVALKVLLPEWSRAPEVVARFEREAIAAGNIAHPHVVAATDFGRLPDGSFFLVLEYIAGRTLRVALEGDPAGAPRALDLGRALKITRGIASAVGAAHAKGIVHRDLKPENVMLIERDGDPDFVKVLDFGVAKVEMTDTTAHKGTGLTKVGMIIGTPDYMSPEQALGQSIDPRTDLYSIGVILFELLTGRCPFQGGAATVLRQHVLTDPPPLSDAGGAFDPRVGALVGRLLQKTPSARYASAAELIAAIDEIARGIAQNVQSTPSDAGAPPSSFGGLTTPSALAHAPTALGPMPAFGAPTLRALWLGPHRARIAGIAAAAMVAMVIALVAMLRASPDSSAEAAAHEPAAASALPPPPSKSPPIAPAESATTAAASTASGSSGASGANGASGASAKPEASSDVQPKSQGASGGKRRRTGPGGIYIPPPNQWFK